MVCIFILKYNTLITYRTYSKLLLPLVFQYIGKVAHNFTNNVHNLSFKTNILHFQTCYIHQFNQFVLRTQFQFMRKIATNCFLICGGGGPTYCMIEGTFPKKQHLIQLQSFNNTNQIIMCYTDGLKKIVYTLVLNQQQKRSTIN